MTSLQQFIKQYAVPAVLGGVLSGTSIAAGIPKEPQAPLQELTDAHALTGAVVKAAPEKTAPEKEKKPAIDDRRGISLGKIDTEVENDLTLITAKLNRQPSWKELVVEDHGTFLQVKLPATAIPNSGEFLDGNGPYLKKIAMFQITNDDGALRLFINQDAAKAKLATTAELLGERVVITIDHKKMEQLIQPAPKEKVAVVVADSTVQTSAKDKELDAVAQKEATDPNAVIKQSTKPVENAEFLDGSNGIDIKGKLVTAAIFCAAMLIMLLGAQMMKKRRLKGRKNYKGGDVNAEPASMRILSNTSISARQKLTLVQVGSQQILIGVSPENITYLTTVEVPAKSNSQSFGAHLLHANPNAEVKLKQTDTTLARPVRKPADAAVTPTPRATTTPAVRPRPTGQQAMAPRVNYAVGDDGISDLKARGVKNDKGHADQPFDDITKLIRDRLRNLPPAP